MAQVDKYTKGNSMDGIYYFHPKPDWVFKFINDDKKVQLSDHDSKKVFNTFTDPHKLELFFKSME